MPVMITGTAERFPNRPDTDTGSESDIRVYRHPAGTFVGTTTDEAHPVCSDRCAETWAATHGYGYLLPPADPRPYCTLSAATRPTTDGTRINTADYYPDEPGDGRCEVCGTPTSDSKVYIVWGPSAEWADGVGVLAYAADYAEAQSVLREEALLEEEYGPRGWRSVHEVGDIEPVRPTYFTCADPVAADRYAEGGIAALVAYLNEAPY